MSTIRGAFNLGFSASGRIHNFMWPSFVDVRIERGRNEMTVRMSFSTFLI